MRIEEEVGSLWPPRAVFNSADAYETAFKIVRTVSSAQCSGVIHSKLNWILFSVQKSVSHVILNYNCGYKYTIHR